MISPWLDLNAMPRLMSFRTLYAPNFSFCDLVFFFPLNFQPQRSTRTKQAKNRSEQLLRPSSKKNDFAYIDFINTILQHSNHKIPKTCFALEDLSNDPMYNLRNFSSSQHVTHLKLKHTLLKSFEHFQHIFSQP